MKKLIMTLALAAVAAAPAFAASHKKTDSARAAYAATVYPPAVIVDGAVIGTDPDPSIRYDLLRDQSLLAN